MNIKISKLLSTKENNTICWVNLSEILSKTVFNNVSYIYTTLTLDGVNY